MANRHGCRIALLTATLVAAWAPAAGAAIGPQQVEALDRQGATDIVVRREPGLSAAERADVRADADVTLRRASTLPDTEVVRADTGELAEAVAELNRDPDVIYAEPVTVQTALSADSYYGSLWGLENVGQKMFLPGTSSYYPSGTVDADMDVPEAWTKATGAGVTVGIVDTGVLTSHPDLAAQIAFNAGETGTDALNRDKRSNGVDDDGNGYRDDWQGWDFVAEYPSIGVSEGDTTAGPDNTPQDNHGHGTHVAGTVAAQADNNAGIAGVAPGARLMPLRALGATGRGSSIAIAEAFDYAGKMGVRVVNASLGGPGLDQSQLAAIQAHPNTLYVIAAGNDNVNNDVTPHGPCALPAANILCVGASDENDRRASFSNYGATSVDVFAPGTAILSTTLSPAYGYMQGTSMASPNAAGVAALVLSARPGIGALDIKSAIMASAEAKPELASRAVTGARVNADRAVTGALGGAPVNVSAPAISGTPRQGIALGASTGVWNPPGTTYAYVWARSFDGGASWTVMPGATASTYTPGASDIGASIRVTVTATNPYGVAGATSAAVGPVGSGAPANTVRPVISGTPRRGQNLAVTSVWSPTGTSYTYQWQRSTDGVNWATIGTSATSYTLTTAERGANVRVLVTATNAFGQTSATSDPVGPVVWDPPVPTTPPTITGTSQRTFTLTAATGAWDGGGNTYSHQWQRDGVDIAGATGATYKLTKDDEGARVRVLVTATNVDGTAQRASDATEAPVAPFPPANTVAPVISGTPQRTKTLTATRGTWTGPDNMYGFQWQRDFGEGYVDIAGATGASYTLTVDDVDALVRVVVTATNPDATIMEASEPTTPVLAAGPLNLTPPTVTGTAQRGLTLTGTAGTWSGFGNSIAYQWQSSADGTVWTTIPGATSASYAIAVGDIGRHLRLLVIVTNPDGTRTATSTATATVTAAPPANTVKPTISGAAQRASTLIAGQGTWSGNGNAYTYQWQRDGIDIAGATGATYTLAAADVGGTVRVLVTAANPDGTATAASNPTATVPAAPPVNTVRPTVTGTAQRGTTLYGTPGTWSGIGNTTSYQWESSADGVAWAPVDGATGVNYTIAVGDAGAALRLLVTVTNPDGSVSAASLATAPVVSTPPVNTVRPTFSGTAQRGSMLVGGPGTWSGAGNGFAYQWQRSGDGASWASIAGATSTAYELTAADVGAMVRLLVTATNPDGTASIASLPTAAIPSSPPVNTVKPAVTGTARRGATLTAGPGTWTGIGNSTAYRWQRSRDQGATWEPIDGATGATYTLVVADVGAIVRVLVTTTNAEGSASRASDPTATVIGDGPVNTVAPSLSGSAERASTLTAAPGSWSGDGNAYAYQWQRSSGGTWANIAGATGAGYVLAVADVGATVRVVVTATNPDGSGSRASAPSATVKAAPPVNTGVPFITGAALRGNTLSASPGTWTGPGIAYAYQWQRDGVAIAGATGATYTLTVADAGARLRVRVTATNADAAVTAVSLESSVVQSSPPRNAGAPTISGPAKLGATLTAAPGDWTPSGLAFTYAWQRDGADIAGATSATYTLQAADVGTRVRVKVTATNVDGVATAISAATERVAAPPASTLAPAAPAGTTRELSTLTADAGGWDTPGVSLTYVWLRCPAEAGAIGTGCVEVGAGSTYTLTDADVGRRLGVRVTGASDGGTTTVAGALSGVVTRLTLANVTPPGVAGEAYAGETLRGDAGRWTFPSPGVTYEWRRCDAGGCTSVGDGALYTLRGLDVGATLALVVTATTPGQSASASSTVLTVQPRPVPRALVAPTITGSARRGSTLQAAVGTWTDSPSGFAYQWRRGGVDIPGAIGDSYRLTKADVGFAVTVAVTAKNAYGDGSATAAPSAPIAAAPPVNTHVPVIQSSGPVVQQGVTLTATGYAWDATDDTTFSLAWERCDAGACQVIPGATGVHYTPLAADVGKKLVVVSAASNVDGSASARSAETAVATMAGPRWKTLPTIAGSGKVGDAVTATPGTWSGPVVTTDTTEIMRCTNVCVARAGTSYTVAAADLGAILRVRETASNAGGETVVWSARYVGPVISAAAAAGVLSARETPLRNAQGTTLALATLSGTLARASAARAGSAKVKLRRAGKAKGKLLAWACQATVGAGATPPPCSAKVTLRKSATLRLPATTAGKVRVVVVRGKG